MDHQEFQKIQKASELAIDRIIAKGTDDVFRPPTFSHSVEAELLATRPDAFKAAALQQTIEFLKHGDLRNAPIGQIYRGLVTKDHNSFRQCA